MKLAKGVCCFLDFVPQTWAALVKESITRFLLALHPYSSTRKEMRTYQSSGTILMDLVVIGGVNSYLTTPSLSLLARKV